MHAASILLKALSPEERTEYILEQGDDGWTALFYACKGGFTETVALLLDSLEIYEDRKRLILHRSAQGYNALMHASWKGAAAAAALLLNALTEPETKRAYILENNCGRTPLTLSAGCGWVDIVALLLDYLDSETRYHYILSSRLNVLILSFQYPSVTSLLIHHLSLANISPNEREKNLLLHAFSRILTAYLDPKLTHQLLHLLPLDEQYSASEEAVFVFQSYFSGILSEQLHLRTPRLYHIMIFLNDLTVRNAALARAIIEHILSCESAGVELVECFSLGLFRCWCLVLDVICKYPSLKTMPECHMNLDMDMNMDMMRAMSIGMGMGSPGFVPLTKALVQFFTLCHKKSSPTTSCTSCHSCHSAGHFLNVFPLFWTGDGEESGSVGDFGGIVSILPVPFLVAFSQEIAALSYSSSQVHNTEGLPVSNRDFDCPLEFSSRFSL